MIKIIVENVEDFISTSDIIRYKNNSTQSSVV